MESDSHILPGLLRKRAEVAGRIAAARAEAEGLARSLDALDATIRLFAPDAALPPLEPARPDAPPPRGRVVRLGGLGRSTLDALREAAAAPLPTRDVAARVVAALGIDAADRAAARLVHKRVGAALREMRDRAVVASEARGDGQTWGRVA